MRLDRGNPLPKSLGRKIAIECDMIGVLEGSADMPETEFSGAARALMFARHAPSHA